jgi:hypothetical protein
MAAKRPIPESLKQFGESLLAAPRGTKGSETERRKYLQRKAMEVAEQEQLKASKSKRRPSDEDILADIRRVAGDKDTNPMGWRFLSISRQRYRLYGHYPIEHVDERYGQFEHAKQVAGLADKPGTRAKKRATAEASRRDHASRYARETLLPHVLDDPRLERELSNTKLVLTISDTHSTFLDPFTWYVFLCACRDLKPDIVVFNGDILEGSEITSYPKIPGWTIPLQLEFDFARSMFEQTRKVVGPDTEIVWTAGNHGLDRWARYLTQVAPALANLRTLRFDKLAGLDDLRITLAQGGTIASPAGAEADAPGLLLYGFFRVHHGTILGQTPALGELKAAGRSGTSGHVHRASLAFGTNESNGTICWMTTPMGCGERAGRAYMKGIAKNWQKGFGVSWLHAGGKVHQYPVIADGGVAIVEGRTYTQSRLLKESDVNKNWLLDFEVPR